MVKNKNLLLRTAVIVFVAVALVFAFQPLKANACNANGPDFGSFANLFQGMFCEGEGAHGAVAGVGKFSIFFPPAKWDFDPLVAEKYFGSWSHAYASVPDAEIKLSAQGKGVTFNWALGAIYDKYTLGEGVDPANVMINIEYDGALSGFSGFGIGLLGDQGFQMFGKLAPGTYDDAWSVSLSDIATVNDNNEFCMAFGAFVFAWGSGSEALFGEADFADTFKMIVTNTEGGQVRVDSEGGFSQVPIPGTILLFIPGLVGIFAFRRKKS